MKRRLSSRLSPQAKQLVMQSPHETVRGMLEMSGAANADHVEQAISALGGQTRSTSLESHVITFEIEAMQLAELAEVDGVMSVSTQESYRA